MRERESLRLDHGATDYFTVPSHMDGMGQFRARPGLQRSPQCLLLSSEFPKILFLMVPGQMHCKANEMIEKIRGRSGLSACRGMLCLSGSIDSF